MGDPGATQVMEPGAGTNDMAALATHLQPVIDELIAMNVNKIVLISHLQQIQLEEQLAGLLTGVAIIVAGGSDAILANEESHLWPADQGNIYAAYPLLTENADAEPCLIVSTNGEYTYVGRLVVDFDANGVVIPSSIDAVVSKPSRAVLASVVELHGDSATAFATDTKGELVQRLVNAVQDVVIVKDSNIMGRSDVYLDGRRSQVRTQETNLGNITADANLWVARSYDATTMVSIKNGGGIRAEIGQVVEVSPGIFEFGPTQANPLSGKQDTEISQLDIENSLRFNNRLSLLTLSADGLKQIIEHGIAAWAPGATPGAFPQIGGMKFSFDPSQPAGSRIVSMALFDEDGTLTDSVVYQGAVYGDPEREIRIVTLNFLAGGGDAYPFTGLGTDRVDLDTVLTDQGAATFTVVGSEQDALSEYLLEFHSVIPYEEAETAPALDQRIQILSFRDDAVYDFSTGIHTGATGTGLRAYPNPANDRLMLDIKTPILAAQVLSISGQQMMDLRTIRNSIDVSDLQPGTYLLRYTTAEGSGVVRFAVIR